MERRKTRRALGLCAALFLAALVIFLLFSHEDGAGLSPNTGSRVVLSEILASNRTYPAPDGRMLDFVEVRNLSDSPVDISGYMLSDDATSVGYTFPAGTVLPPQGYAVCWCDKDDDSGRFASFGISKDGKDNICLYNTANVRIDEKQVPRMNANVPLVRLADGTWDTAQQATPGYENTQEGYAAWLHSMGGDETAVIISEVMTGNDTVMTGPGAAPCDFVELYNPGKKEAVLTGGYLSDDPDDPAKWQIPELRLGPGEYAVIRCAGESAGEGEAGFSLSREGCTVTLMGSMGNILSQVNCPAIPRDCAWAMLEDDSYGQMAFATPGFENTLLGYEMWLDAQKIGEMNVTISEVMPGNYSTVLNGRGQLCDWVEVYNAGDAPVDLSRGYLSDDPENRGKWQIPSSILAPGERRILCCSGDGAGEGEADFSLSRSGCTVLLTGPAGNLLSQVSCPQLSRDHTWALEDTGDYVQTALPSPGFENTEEGYFAYQQTRAPLGSLMITEAMPSNNQFLRQADGECYDWVELKNNSEETLNLADYALSNDPDDLGLFPLPEEILDPGERIVIICSGNTELSGAYIHAPFTLSREESWVYLTDAQGKLLDSIRIRAVPGGCSVGRPEGENGTVYFSDPTPDGRNGEGMALQCPPPAITAGGVFNGVDEIRVELSGEGEVHYTLDGSVPTEHSPLYTEPISLGKTTTVRAVSIDPGKLESDAVTASYIINENHTLPVVSVSLEPGDFSYIYTYYNRNVEVPCHLELFEGGEGFSIDCGIKMYGHMGLENPKKSFKVNFRPRYSGLLNYPVYGEEGPQTYESLCIRSGQDYPMAIFRDELFTSLCRQMTDTVLAQRDKFCILYVNGRYYGIYCMKEAFSEMFYAENKNVSPESVTLEQAPVDVSSEIFDLIRYCNRHDMSLDENYEYVASQVDVDSMIDWMIVEGYSTNGDVQQNLRYFKSTETGDKWQFAFYDLDWAFYYHYPMSHVLSPNQTWQHMGLTRGMMENATFRKAFLERLSYHMENTLSNENVLARIDYYEALLAPEVERERDRWGGSYAGWEADVQELRDFITYHDHLGAIVDQLEYFIGLTDAEIQQYFARWA